MSKLSRAKKQQLRAMGIKGGRAKALKMTPQQRHAWGKDMAARRWAGHVKKLRPPFAWCNGAPTREDCARAGRCLREPSCE